MKHRTLRYCFFVIFMGKIALFKAGIVHRLCDFACKLNDKSIDEIEYYSKEIKETRERYKRLKYTSEDY